MRYAAEAHGWVALSTIDVQMKSKILSIVFIGAFLTCCAPAVADAPTETVIPTSTFTPYPTATNTLIPTHSPTETLRPTWTPVETATPILTLTPSDYLSSGSISYWDQVIAQDPENADAYFQRATIIYETAVKRGFLEVYISKLDQALMDIDKAISLRSDIGDYYALRQSLYWERSWTTEIRVDQQYLVAIALDNAYKAYELGTTIEEYPERIIVIDLIFTNQCQKALQEIEKLIAQLPAGDRSLGGLLHIRSQAYACLGRLDEALQSVNDSMFNNMNMGFKKGLIIDYLIMLGRYSEALPMLDDQIRKSELGGFRYYLRAVVYYNLGMKDLVRDELSEGMPRTWGRAGWLAYVEAQMALDEGRTEDAIELLQLAEATFSPTYNPVRWKIQKQLRSLGAQPLTLTPSVPFLSTPIP
jgi:tetratricopeptide (TPR) repeat protein